MKSRMLFKVPIKNDWAFWTYLIFTLINAGGTYRDFYSGGSPTTAGIFAATFDLSVIPLLGTYIIMLVILIPRFVYWKWQSRS